MLRSMLARLRTRNTIQDILLISALWLLATLLVNPIGNFPLNDDWSYGLAVKRLLEEGSFRPTGWTAMTLFSQVLWGALFCLPFGFSFTALRLSTLVLGLGGMLGLYLLLVKQFELSRPIGLIVALTVGFNPLFFVLSHTFMTDVPFTSFGIGAALFFLRSLVRETDSDLLIGLFFAVLATLCRQLGLFIPIAFGFTLLLKHGGSPKWLVRAIVPTLMALAAIFGLNTWLELTNSIPKDYNRNVTILLTLLSSSSLKWSDLISNALTIVLYVGLLSLPVGILPAYTSGRDRLYSWRNLSTLLVLGMLVLALRNTGRIMPLSKNILNETGVGPITLFDTYILAQPHLPAIPGWFWKLITGFSLLGAALLLSHSAAVLGGLFGTIKTLRQDNHKLAAVFALTAIAIYIVPLLFGDIFDRYLLPLLPLMSLALVPLLRAPDRLRSRWPIVLAMLVLVLFAGISIAGTRDYLEWNRKRWEILRHLTETRHIPTALIDGGFEFNGWSLYEDTFQGRGKSWWWVKDDLYMIAMGEVAGYDTIQQYHFSRWVPPADGTIYLLRRRDCRAHRVTLPCQYNSKDALWLNQ